MAQGDNASGGPDLTTAIDQAEEGVRTELDALRSELESLARRAGRARSEGERLTHVREEARKVERAIQAASQGLQPQDGRPPEPEAGEQVDEERARQVIEMRREGA